MIEIKLMRSYNQILDIIKISKKMNLIIDIKKIGRITLNMTIKIFRMTQKNKSIVNSDNQKISIDLISTQKIIKEINRDLEIIIIIKKIIMIIIRTIIIEIKEGNLITILIVEEDIPMIEKVIINIEKIIIKIEMNSTEVNNSYNIENRDKTCILIEIITKDIKIDIMMKIKQINSIISRQNKMMKNIMINLKIITDIIVQDSLIIINKDYLTIILQINFRKTKLDSKIFNLKQNFHD